MKLPPEEQAAYDRYQDDLHYQAACSNPRLLTVILSRPRYCFEPAQKGYAHWGIRRSDGIVCNRVECPRP